MSKQVDPARLGETLADFGTGYLLTTSGDGRIKVVAVDPGPTADGLVIDGPGKGSAANIAKIPQVTVLFPPLEQHGYALIVDGQAEGDADHAVVQVSGAVLHRPARYADGPTTTEGCDQDCQRLE